MAPAPRRPLRTNLITLFRSGCPVSQGVNKISNTRKTKKKYFQYEISLSRSNDVYRLP